MNIKIFTSKPMSTGDSTLMLLLSLNLLLLVFFMMLNSMATYGAKHAKDVLSDVRGGYKLPPKDGKGEAAVQPALEVPQAAWRAGVVSRMQGMVLNRVELKVLPQQGNANKVELEIPFSALFDADGKLVKPEMVRNIKAVAGVESEISWQVRGNWGNRLRLARLLASLAVETGGAEFVAGTEGLVVSIRPGNGALSGMGLQLQQAGERAGGKLQGVEEKDVPRE